MPDEKTDQRLAGPMTIPTDKMMTIREFAEQLGFKSGDKINTRTDAMIRQSYSRYVLSYQDAQFKLTRDERKAMTDIAKAAMKREQSGASGREGLMKVVEDYGKLERLNLAIVDRLNEDYDDPERPRTVVEKMPLYQALVQMLGAQQIKYVAQDQGTTPDQLGQVPARPMPSLPAAEASGGIVPQIPRGAGQIIPESIRQSGSTGAPQIGGRKRRALQNRRTGEIMIQDQQGQWTPYVQGQPGRN